MEQKFIVQIFVSDKNSNLGTVATGYPVSDEFVLTARHALTPSRDSAGKIDTELIEMRWFQLENQWHGISKTDIVWDDETLDLALVRFRPPANNVLHVALSDQIPASHWQWHSVCFPNLNRDDKPETIDGTTQQPSGGNGRFTLVSHLQPKENPRLWEGASGAPVFVRDQIVGVILEVQPRATKGWDKDQLIAIAISHVFEKDEDFRLHIRPNDPDNKYFSTLLVDIADLLTCYDEYLLDQLVKRIPQAESVNDGTDSDELAKAMARRLLTAQFFEPVKNALEKLYLDLEKKKEKKDPNFRPDNLDNLWKLYVAVLTYRYHPDGVNRIIKHQQSGTDALLRFEAVTCAAVELMMACLDKHAAAFILQPVSTKDANGEEHFSYDIRSEFQLPMPPETGRDPDGFMREFLLHLNTIFQRPLEHRPKSDYAIARDIKKHIKKKIAEDGRTRFIVFLPDDPSHQYDYVLLANQINEYFKDPDRAFVKAVLVKSEKEEDHDQWQDKEDELEFLRQTLWKRMG